MRQRTFPQLDCFGATTMEDILIHIELMRLNDNKHLPYFRNGALDRISTNNQTETTVKYNRRMMPYNKLIKEN